MSSGFIIPKLRIQIATELNPSETKTGVLSASNEKRTSTKTIRVFIWSSPLAKSPAKSLMQYKSIKPQDMGTQR